MTIHDIPSGTSTAEVRRRHHKALDMARRGLAMVQNRTNDLAPAVLEQPSTYYVDPERYAREVEVLFHRRPVFAALSVELPGPGAFKALDLPGFPLVVTRQQDGSLRAMLNSCRHRGSTIATGAGSARAFVCKYHGWTYDLDGSLRRIRAERNFGEIDPSCTGLVQVAVAEKYGMVFVRATPLERDPSPIDVDELLCGMGPQLDDWRLDLSEPVSSATVDTASNWKLAVDTYLETYHFATLHKTTVAKSNFSDHAPFDTYGPHSLTGFLSRNIEKLAEQPEAQWSPMKHVQMVYTLFPNTVMTVMQDHVEYSQILPGPTWDRNTMHHLYFSFPDFRSAEIHSSRFDRTQWILAEEDCPMAEEMHRNLASGGLPSVRYGRNEPGLQHQHRSIAAVLDGSA